MSQASPTTKDLEDQLRGMILSNVTIAGGQNHYDNQSTQHRGRGRGRGGFYRGSGQQPRGGHGYHSNRGAPSHGMNMASSSMRGGRPGFHGNGMEPRHQQPQSHAYAQTRNDASAPQILQRPQGGYHQAGPGQRGGGTHQYPRPQYTQNGYQSQPRIDVAAQSQFMEEIVERELPKVQMTDQEVSKHETFRKGLEATMRNAFANTGGEDLDHIKDISLVAFGSLGSGFALPGSDMDLAVVPQWNEPARADETDIGPRIPRLLEKAVLDAKMGGRLLTRTRVPILKVCETPTDALYTALSDEREKWEGLSEEEKYPQASSSTVPAPVPPPTLDEIETEKAPKADEKEVIAEPRQQATTATAGASTVNPADLTVDVNTSAEKAPNAASHAEPADTSSTSANKETHNRTEKQWHREKVLGPLDFPKTGVGIQCDINFANPLGIHNTHMLRCYSLTDPRVRPMVLFVKSWAKRRKINSSYSGTLSSYGWVLMVLHYLVNVASPPVCPNLQHYLPQATDLNSLTERFKDAKKISGYDVRFWRNEEEIIRAAQEGRLTQNRQSLAALLCGFYRYFASQGGHYGRQANFYWTSEVLSLRTPGGIVSKQDKGWVSATTIVTAEKKVTNRYLFAIEDPFETDHNVARTVTHRGIVTIRDEFRRAGRILGAVGRGMEPEGGLFDELIEEAPVPTAKTEQPEVTPPIESHKSQ
ncbi:hypothetical protein E8E13_009670 [Curvularia kusanoi]|uniref:polynucleotide adenylyltransferase n=1 Tax=Curvularia kusanoi TaxID=90978 RepID=A0A9P4W8D3_CURKU|nr:hypothetical protein E8E13_009670 [Curvularia kusanoi]